MGVAYDPIREMDQLLKSMCNLHCTLGAGDEIESHTGEKPANREIGYNSSAISPDRTNEIDNHRCYDNFYSNRRDDCSVFQKVGNGCVEKMVNSIEGIEKCESPKPTSDKP